MAPRRNTHLRTESMQDFWPASSYLHLERTPRGWLRPTDAWLRGFLALPELALVEDSCDAEKIGRAHV